MLEKIGNTFTNILIGIRDFFLGIWNAFVGLLSSFLPDEFAYMLAIVVLVALVLVLIKTFLYRGGSR